MVFNRISIGQSVKFAYILFVLVPVLTGCGIDWGLVHKASPPGLETYKPQASSRSKLVGRWYGERKLDNGGQVQWLFEHFADGTYQVDFRRSNIAGEVGYTTEVGHWGVSGPVYFCLMRGWLIEESIRPADVSNPANYDAYRIIRLDGMRFEYEHFANGNRYSVQRVAADFRLP